MKAAEFRDIAKNAFKLVNILKLLLHLYTFVLDADNFLLAELTC